MAESVITTELVEAVAGVVTDMGHPMSLSLSQLSKGLYEAAESHPCNVLSLRRPISERMRECLTRFLDFNRDKRAREMGFEGPTPGLKMLESQWNHGFRVKNDRLTSAMRDTDMREGWADVGVVDPLDLFAVASASWACVATKGPMRVAGVAGQAAFGGPHGDDGEGEDEDGDGDGGDGESESETESETESESEDGDGGEDGDEDKDDHQEPRHSQGALVAQPPGRLVPLHRMLSSCIGPV